MTLFIEDLFSFLSNAGTDAGNRFYPNRLPQKVTLPATRYFRVSNPIDYTQSGASDLKNPRFQFDCYAETYLAAVQLANQLVDLLSGFKGEMGSHKVEAALVEDEGKDDHDPETGRQRVSVDVMISNKEI